MALNTIDGVNRANASATNYIDLSSKMYRLYLDALTSRAQRRLQYWKAVWDISFQPYQSAAGERALRDAFGRAIHILELTANELTVDREKLAELSEKVISYSTKFQDLNASFGGVVATSLARSNAVSNQAKAATEQQSSSGRESYYGEESAQHQSNGGANRTEEVKRRTAAAAKPQPAP